MPRDGKGADLAIVFGPAKGGKKPPAAEAEDTADMVPPDFEAAALEAFPEMSPERMAAFKRAIEACVESRSAGAYDEELTDA